MVLFQSKEKSNTSDKRMLAKSKGIARGKSNSGIKTSLKRTLTVKAEIRVPKAQNPKLEKTSKPKKMGN